VNSENASFDLSYINCVVFSSTIFDLKVFEMAVSQNAWQYC